jgi:hypothetical protein
MKSNFGSFNKSDALRAFILFVVVTIMGSLLNALQQGNFEFTWVFFKPIVFADLTVILSYVIKNFLTNSEDKFLTSEK